MIDGNTAASIYGHNDGLVQDCSIPSALAMEILQSYANHR